MRLQWKGKNYRPAANYVRVYKPDINELMKPLSEKRGLGSAILTGEIISGIGDAYAPDVTPVVSPTPSITPSITPSSTPFLFPTPDLWYDATDSSSMFLVLSGGTTFLDKWTSKGNYTWELSAATANRRPVVSGSTLFPSTQQVVRFNRSAIVAEQDGLTGFNLPAIPHSGSTTFIVFAKPLATSYQPGSSNAAGAYMQFYSGLTNGGVAVSGAANLDRYFWQNSGNNLISSNAYAPTSQSMALSGWTGSAIQDKFLYKAINIYPTGFSQSFSNTLSGQSTLSFTGINYQAQWNAATIGVQITTSGGAQTFVAMNMEMGEIMIFNRNLSASEQLQVENYLKDKWQYDEWSIAPTPSVTPTNTITPTPSVTNTATPTVTPTITSSPTPSPIPPDLSFIVGSGSTAQEACDNLSTGNTSTIYAYDIGNCTGCLPQNCWACLNTSQPIYQDAQGTVLAASAYYANEVSTGNFQRLYIDSGFISGGTYTAC